MYSIGILIKSTIQNKGIKKVDVVKGLGYRNITKGLRRLNDCIQGEGKCSKKFLREVAGVLGIKEQVLDEAIEKTEDECRLEREEAARRREIYARKNFKPYIYIKTSETRPKSIGIVAFAGAAVYKCVGLPEEISSWPIERQIREVSKTVKRNYRERNGHSGQFGKITGYIYYRTYDEGIEFSIEGEVVGDSLGKPVEDTEITLQVGNKTIVGGLLGVFKRS